MTSPKIILGIDPGIGGAVAILGESGSLLEVHDAPILHDGPKGRKSLNAPLLSSIIANSHADIVFVEQVSARPMEGVSSSFGFGRSRGVIEGICAALDLPISWITPASWHKLVAIPVGADKDMSRARAIERWPAQAALFKRKLDHGRGDAALIGLAGLLRNGVSK